MMAEMRAVPVYGRTSCDILCVSSRCDVVKAFSDDVKRDAMDTSARCAHGVRTCAIENASPTNSANDKSEWSDLHFRLATAKQPRALLHLF